MSAAIRISILALLFFGIYFSNMVIYNILLISLRLRLLIFSVYRPF